MNLSKTLQKITSRKETLDPNIWENDIIKDDVKLTLLEIAEDFWSSIKKPGIKLIDIVVLGSSCNYYWTENSDLDLHLVYVAESNEIDEELLNDFFILRSGAWNDKHDIEIYGHPLEIFVKKEDPGYSDSIYSLIKNKWVKKPDKNSTPKFNKELTLEKAKILGEKIKSIISQLENSPSEKIIDSAESIREKIRKMRDHGLASGGEFSTENLTFKILRRLKLIENLKNSISKAYDRIHMM
jgi:hypothetical protein